MDVFFLVMTFSGFIKGLFFGLRKTVKNALIIILAVSGTVMFVKIFSRSFFEINLFKEEIYNFFKNKVFPLSDVFYLKIDDNVAENIKQSFVPDFLKKLLSNFCLTGSNLETVGEAFCQGIYRLIAVCVFAIIVFALFAILLKIALGFCFRFKTKNENLFFTKRFLAGAFGVVKSCAVFLSIVTILSFFVEAGGFLFAKNALKTSKIATFFQNIVSQDVKIFVSEIF